VHAVVGTDRGYLIAGMVGETFDDPATSPRIWYSNDAMTWTPATLEGSERLGGIEQVAIDGSGRWVAIGTLDSRIVVWRSTDRGLSWAITADLGPVGGSLRAEYRLAGAPDGFIAFSATDPATTWTSHDGVSWTAAPEHRPSGTPEELQISWKTGIARIGDTMVVAGEAFGPQGQTEETWFSWIGTIQR
jgi:hypothetical protein